jgi:hypothetical protein
MAQTPQWFDLTDQIRSLPSSWHDQIVAIMVSLDKRYVGLRTHREPGSNRSRLTDWVNRKLGGHTVSVVGATYAEETGGPLRRVCGVLHDCDPDTGGWSNMRLEMVGIDHDYPEHCDETQWNRESFSVWSRDFRRVVIALATSGEPMKVPREPSPVRLRAYAPAKMGGWGPMKDLQDYIFRELAEGHGGYLIDPPHFAPSSDWVDYDFVINEL